MYMAISSLYMFLANYMAQNIIDHNNHVFSTVYNVKWYRTPLHIQKVILFLLQRNTKKFVLNVGGIFEGSVEHFATLMKASVSYFTVIYSTR
ncbi:OR43A protein, partial [Acromyrmex charruanus]